MLQCYNGYVQHTQIYYGIQYGGVLIENLLEFVGGKSKHHIDLGWVWALDYSREIEEKFSEYFQLIESISCQ